MRFTLLAAVFLAAISAAHAQEKVVHLTSLEWPPYTGAALQDQGAAVAVAKAAFEAVGYKLEVTFVPWNRAVEMAKSDSKVIGYFPEYYAPSLEAEFALSNPIGTGPLGVAERKDSPVSWQSVADLQPYRIGVVDGYINTEELDAAIADGRLKADKAIDDSTNLKKLAGARTDLAVVDRNVMSWLIANDAEVGKIADKIQFNARLLEDKQLFICFRNDAEGQRMRDLFNEGLSKIDAAAIAAKYF